MLAWLLRVSVHHRARVLLLAAVVLAWGASVITTLPVDVLPNLDRPTVNVLAEAEGLTAEEADLRVARPIQDALAGIPGVEIVRTRATSGLGAVSVVFADDVDPAVARTRVAERLGAAQAVLPEGVAPVMAPLASIMGEVLLVGYVPAAPEGASELRAWVDRAVRPALQAVPGVAQVTVMGGGVAEVQVEVDPARLAASGVLFRAVVEAVAAAQGRATTIPIADGDRAVEVVVDARALSPGALAAAPVHAEGLRVGDVATVMLGLAPRVGEASVDGARAVVVSVQKQPGVDTLALTEALSARLEALDAGSAPGARRVTLFQQAEFVRAAVENVEVALRDGAILVAVVLALFLAEWRATVISLVAIPASLLLAALALRGLGLGVDTMTLGGLAIAVGELVDDAIVDVENVRRRLRVAEEGFTAKVVAASQEVRGSIVFSTLVVVLVFVPLLALPGVEGRLFLPLGVAYIVSILASLVVSLTLTPALCRVLLPGVGARGEGEDTRVVRGLKRAHLRALRWSLPRPGLVLVLASLVVLSAVATLPLVGRAFLPPFAEATATVNLVAPPGISLDASDAIGRAAEALILEVPEVAGTGRRTGRAELDEHAEGVHASEIEVRFREGGRPRAEVLADVRAHLAGLPGVGIAVGAPIGHRVDHLLSGVQAALAVKLYGEDGAALREASVIVVDALRAVPGTADVRVERQDLVTGVHVALDPVAAARLGVPAGRLAEDLAGALGGMDGGSLVDGARRIGVRVRLATGALALLAQSPWVLPDGRVVPLAALASVEERTAPAAVQREAGQRRVVVSANVADADVGAVSDAVARRLGALSLPSGVTAQLAGQGVSARDATRRVLLLAGVALVGMLLVLRHHLRSLSLVAQVLLSVPFAMVGAVAALLLGGQPLSVATAVGLVTLGGIATRNTILLVDHYLHLAREEGLPFGEELVVRGSLERIVPVAMTALCAGIALLPLALSAGEPGREILAPVAQVILGGLVSSTLLDLVVTPTVFLRFGRPALERFLVSPMESP